MNEVAKKARWVAGFVLSFILIGAGVMKFTNGHAFQYLESETGIKFLHPYINNVVGTAEITAGIMIRFRRTRRAGGYAALAIVSGAVLAHLTPWLGILTPTGFADGAAAPWDRTDFTVSTTPALFITALITLALALAVVAPDVRPKQANPSSDSTKKTAPIDQPLAISA